ncbi:MAG TPA: transcriptional regulator, partial [Planctomycetes bacterium]|nr:transcriptional regulator [Planctomycetota bacterium]
MSIRSYHQICSVARALDLIGERWTMLIVRDLMIGPMRYSELLASLPGITTNLLAKRLRSLQDQGILEKIPPGTPAKGPQTSQSPETPQPSQTAPSPDSPLPTPRPPSSKNSLYALTDKGRALEPVLKALGEWGMTHGRPPQPDDQI